jgi:mono/diheme cytochrome c family protein
MSKRTFIAFGLLVIVLAVVIPWLIFNSKGDAQNGDQSVASDLKSGQSLFQVNCGTCHTLYAAGTDGNYGPNLDELLAPTGPPEGDEKEVEEAAKGVEERVLNAINTAITGRMPKGIVAGGEAEAGADFVAANAGN